MRKEKRERGRERERERETKGGAMAGHGEPTCREKAKKKEMTDPKDER